MDDPVLLVRVEKEGDADLRVLSPGVGLWSGPPHLGAHVGPGSRIGSLEHLNRRFALLLPDGVAGVVQGPLSRDRVRAVEYAELLFVLRARGRDADPLEASDALRPGQPADSGLAAGTWAIVSPTDGTFYRRPAADAAPFVEVGCRVAAGQPVGLVEVMKTFNQVLYGGPGLPDEAQVIEIRCGDAQEVRAGQVLVVVR